MSSSELDATLVMAEASIKSLRSALENLEESRNRLAEDYNRAVYKFDTVRAYLAQFVERIGGDPMDDYEGDHEWHEELMKQADHRLAILEAALRDARAHRLSPASETYRALRDAGMLEES